MKYAYEFGKMFQMLDDGVSTRSSRILDSMHDTIAAQVEALGYKTQREIEFIGAYGTKKVDIAILNDKSEIIGAIMFKCIRSNYNKNANNYFENMRGENSLFLDKDIPVYQIIFIPTTVKTKDGWEHPTEKSYLNYCNYIANYLPKKAKVGVYYFDIDYSANTAVYSDKRVPCVEKTLSEGIDNFIKEYF